MGQVPDEEDPWSLIERLMAAFPPGSFLALSDGTDTSPSLAAAIEAYNQNSSDSYHLRSPLASPRSSAAWRWSSRESS